MKLNRAWDAIYLSYLLAPVDEHGVSSTAAAATAAPSSVAAAAAKASPTQDGSDDSSSDDSSIHPRQLHPGSPAHKKQKSSPTDAVSTSAGRPTKKASVSPKRKGKSVKGIVTNIIGIGSTAGILSSKKKPSESKPSASAPQVTPRSSAPDAPSPRNTIYIVPPLEMLKECDFNKLDGEHQLYIAQHYDCDTIDAFRNLYGLQKKSSVSGKCSTVLTILPSQILLR